MDEPPYPFHAEPTEFTYFFESIKGKDSVRKVVIFTDIASNRLYNLALLDELPDGTLSDTNVTDNDDMTKVLATVFRIIVDFTNRFPESFVYFSGSDARRTRLYRIALSRELKRLETDYVVLGQIGTEIHPFTKNKHFDGFLLRRKQ